MPAEEVRQRFQADLLQPVLDFANVWFRNADRITFHDPLAASSIFDDQICVFEKGYVEVELDNPKFQGMTYWEPNVTVPRHEVALDVNPERFFEYLFSVF
jgi:inosine-uridine nucleoside N-ribohydrolase